MPLVPQQRLRQVLGHLEVAMPDSDALAFVVRLAQGALVRAGFLVPPYEPGTLDEATQEAWRQAAEQYGLPPAFEPDAVDSLLARLERRLVHVAEERLWEHQASLRAYQRLEAELLAETEHRLWTALAQLIEQKAPELARLARHVETFQLGADLTDEQPARPGRPPADSGATCGEVADRKGKREVADAAGQTERQQGRGEVEPSHQQVVRPYPGLVTSLRQQFDALRTAIGSEDEDRVEREEETVLARGDEIESSMVVQNWVQDLRMRLIEDEEKLLESQKRDLMLFADLVERYDAVRFRWLEKHGEALATEQRLLGSMLELIERFQCTGCRAGPADHRRGE